MAGHWSPRTFTLEDGHIAKLDAIRYKGNFKSRSAALRWVLNRAYQP